MAIASVGTLGTGAHSTSASSYTFATTTNALASGDFGILVNVTDNVSTSDGNPNEHTSVSGGTGTWTKLGEYCNSGGAAAGGVVVSVWLFQASGTVAIGTTITLNLAGAVVDKAASFWKFTKAAGTSIVPDTAPATNPITSEVNAASGFGSSAFTGLASAARLYFRGLAKEANSTTQLTVSTSFTAITNSRSRNNTLAIGAWGEFRINTSTGETSNPTLAVTGDTAGLFLSLVEQLTPISGTVAATLGGSSVASAGTVAVSGAVAKTLGGSSVAAAGAVAVSGSVSAPLGGSTIVAVGTVEDTGISGAVAATLGGSAAAATGTVETHGTVASTLGGSSVSSAGAVDVAGTVSKTLGGSSASATGTVAVAGTVARTLGGSAASSSGTVETHGAVAGSLGGSTIASSGAVDVKASVARTLGGSSLASSGTVGNVPIEGSLSATLGGTTSSSSGKVDVAGAASGTLAGSTGAAAGSVETYGAVTRTLGGSAVTAGGSVDVSGAGGGSLGGSSVAAMGHVGEDEIVIVADLAGTLLPDFATIEGVLLGDEHALSGTLLPDLTDLSSSLEM